MLQAVRVKVYDADLGQVLVPQDLPHQPSKPSSDGTLRHRRLLASKTGSHQIVVWSQLRHLDHDVPDDVVLLHERPGVDDADLHTAPRVAHQGADTSLLQRTAAAPTASTSAVEGQNSRVSSQLVKAVWCL